MMMIQLFYNHTGNLIGFITGSPDPRQQAAAEGEQAQGLVHLIVNIINIINSMHLRPTILQSYNRYTGSAQQQGSDILEATTHHIKVWLFHHTKVCVSPHDIMAYLCHA